ncbi:NDP-sugar synthase [Patulibacter sp.]|uniref:NDP-sugar synthase n=1 Tax=Patulibacter sp. TaxID=1912859 RepID=UPI002722DFD0|nr:NDP-sugar synthase [Patulibacter sp.]MDO9410748.1 NDP-sugar synthase [Patulibacter sp.]
MASTQAVILVGGKGTRLRPLTSNRPKPIVPLVDRPFMAYMLEWVASHGITDVVMCCGFLADQMVEEIGDGEAYGLHITWVSEPEPRGTAGALWYAHPHLRDERFLMLNGDVLTDMDLSAQIAQHERTGATGTLALVPVEDPTAYGLVRLHEDQSVRGFLEKPTPEQIDTDLISAGAYVLEPSIFDLIPKDRLVSIEREVWPKLVGHGLYGCVHRGKYWMDIGTPQRYLEGTQDILAWRVRTKVAERLRDGPVDPGATVGDGAVVDRASLVDTGARVGDRATIGAGSIVGPGATIGDDAILQNAVVLAGATVGAGARLRDCIVGIDAVLGDGVVMSDAAMVGDGAHVAEGNVLSHGLRVGPGAQVAPGTLWF